MKLSENTINILKNFSSINPSIQFKKGKILKTISPLRTIFVEATIQEDFSQEFALFDLNKLLSKISLYKDADLDLGADKVLISADKKSDYIKYCSPAVIIVPPEKSISLGSSDCSFDLNKEDLDWMRKTAGISGSPNFIFESDGEVVNFIATDIKDDSSDQSKIEIAKVDDGKKFRVVMKVENFKLIDGSYNVSIAKKGLAMFKHKTMNITYYIAIEAANSKFD